MGYEPIDTSKCKDCYMVKEHQHQTPYCRYERKYWKCETCGVCLGRCEIHQTGDGRIFCEKCMLSRSRQEVSDYGTVPPIPQNVQMQECQRCALKPENDFCPYVWCMGEIKTGPCDEFTTYEKVIGGQVGELREQLIKFKQEQLLAKCVKEGYRQFFGKVVTKARQAGRIIELEDEES